MDLYRMFVRPEGRDGEYAASLMEENGGPMARQAVGRLDLSSSDHVIEIGFGPGVGIETLLRAVPAGHVAGVDHSPLMHRRAANRNADAIADGRVTLIEGSVQNLPFADNSFDAGLAIDNLHFWPDRLAGLKELRRVLKPGALFVCAFTPVSGGSGHGLVSLFEKTDFGSISVEEGPAGFSISGCVLK